MVMFGLPPQSNMVNFNPPAYQPFSGGSGIMSNPMLQMAMARYLPAQVGKDNFLPSLVPSQHLFDQYTAMKYQNARMEGLAGIQDIDQQAMTANALAVRSAVTDAPATAMNVQQASNIAGMINDPVARMALSQIMGPEMMEDMFYGQKGSAENLYQSVARTGFFRKDPTGREDKMTAESLSGVTREMFAQMYGPGADMSKMNGINAGRAGGIYEDMFRRGSLPKSLGSMSAADRVKIIGQELPTDDETLTRMAESYSREQLTASTTKFDGDKTFAQLSRPRQEEEISKVLSGNKTKIQEDLKAMRDFNSGTSAMRSPAEVEQLESFGVASRTVDATRITKAIQERTGAVAAVREIFGEAGNPNAPFNELLNALEALTQNQVGKASPQKIEQSVRELQMAARGAGVGLQAMLGLSAQNAAFTDQLGLDRSFATSSTLAGLRAGEAGREAGTFNRGFGSLTQEKAMVSAGYLESAAAASPTGNMLGVVARTVTEDRAAHYDDQGRPKTAVAAMHEALKNNAETFIDPETGEEINLQEGLQSGSATEFLQNIVLRNGGDRAAMQARILDVQGNQEFTGQYTNIAGKTQRANIVGDIGFIQGSQLAMDNKSLGEDRAKQMGTYMTEALIEATHSGIAPGERIASYEAHIRKQIIDDEMKKLETSDPDMDEETRRATAGDRATEYMNAAFGTGQERKNKLQANMATGNSLLASMGRRAGFTEYEMKDRYNLEAIKKESELAEKQQTRARQMSAFGSAQTPVVARIRDSLLGLASGATSEDALQAVMNIIPESHLTVGMKEGTEEIMRGVVSDTASKEQLKMGRAGAIVRALDEGSVEATDIGSRALAEQMLGYDPGVLTEEAIAEKEELSKHLIAGDEDAVEEFMRAKNPEITDEQVKSARQQAKTYGEVAQSGKGFSERNTFSIVEDRQKALQDIVAAAEKDPKVMHALEKSEAGRKLIELSKAKPTDRETRKKLEEELGGIDAFGNKRYQTIVDEGVATLADDSEAKKLAKEATKTAEADKTTDAADPAKAVGDLASVVTKASPALDGITKAAEEAAKALSTLPAVIALIGPDKVMEAAAATATAAAGKGVDAVAGAATDIAGKGKGNGVTDAVADVATDIAGKGVSAITDTVMNMASSGIKDVIADLITSRTAKNDAATSPDGMSAGGPAELVGTLTLVGLDRVRLAGQSNMLEQTPGNGAGVHTGAVTGIA